LRAERDEAVSKLRAAEQQLKKGTPPSEKAEEAEAAEAEAEEPSKAEAKAPKEPRARDKKAQEAEKEPEAEEEADAEPSGPVDLNKATFEQLRRLGFSAAQANRVIAYRDRLGGYKSVDDLETVPGIAREFVTKLEDRLKV